MRVRQAVASCLIAAVAGCAGSDTSDGAPALDTVTSPHSGLPTDDPDASVVSGTQPGPDHGDLTPRVVAEGLDVPWGVAFLPDGTALIAERDTGVIQKMDADGTLAAVGTVPGVVPTSEGGLLGLAVSPSYATDHTLYAYVTTAVDNRVVKLSYADRRLGDGTPILTGIPAGQIHDGGRIGFGPDGKLYATTGETGDEMIAQDLDSLGGKILRVEPDGSVPTDNPDPSSPVWTSGHRNVQGIAWDDDDRLWSTEFGSDLWDELNLITAGADYGWPAAEGAVHLDGFTDPLIQWSTGDASPSGIAYLDGFLYVAGLRGARLYRIPLDSAGLGEPEALFTGDYGRLRTVTATPDGALWFTTSNRDGRGQPAAADDRILEIRP